MPVFLLTYTTPCTDHAVTKTLEWITDSDWDAARTAASFHRRYPDAALVRCEEIHRCH